VAVAIDLGSRMLHLAVGEASNGSINVNHSQLMRLPTDALGDDSGTRRNAIAEMLKPVLKELAIRRTEGLISLSFSRFLLRELEIPSGTPEEILQMVRNELVHFSNAQTSDIVEVHQLEGRVLTDGRLAVQGAVMDKALVENYYALLTDLGLKPAVLTLHNNTLAALTRTKPLVNGASLVDRTAVFLDLGMDATLVQIVSDGQVFISRHLPIGFSELDRIISNGLGRTMDEADEARLHTFSFNPDTPSYHALGASQQQVELFVSRLADELVKIVRFFASSIGRGRPAEIIYLYGTGADVRGLVERLTKITTLPVEKISSMSNITMQKSEDADNLHLMLNACGLLGWHSASAGRKV